MKLGWSAVAATIAAVSIAVGVVAHDRGAEAQEPGPSAGALLTDGLLQPKNMKIGPDGFLYVAESGTGGDTPITLPDGVETSVGPTGRISRIDTATGARTTVIEGLPSSLGPVNDAVGPTDVDFIDGDLYYLQTHGGEDWGFPDTPTGIYRVEDDGTATLVADIGQFNIDNPVDSITSGAQPDVEPGGNPYSMMVRDDVFYVVDGNHNRLIRATTTGEVSEIVEFPDHPVSTGITQSSDTSPFTVSYFGAAPFLPEDGRIVTAALPSGPVTEVTRGESMLTDVEYGPGGQLYALQFNDSVEAGADLFAPFTGKILKVNSDGSMSPVVIGLTFTTGMHFDGDTAYVANDGLNALGTGQVWRIDNFSSVTPPAPTPTAIATAPPPAPTPTPSGITAPDTGTGADGGGASSTWLYALLAAGAAIALAGATVRARSR